MALGVTLNVAGLAYFKYFNFVASTAYSALGWNFSNANITLPLAISFYTFQQIAFIIDTYRGEVGRVSIRNYVLSVLFFPHLIAGPLLHYRNIIGQFQTKFSISSHNLSIGLLLFAIGLSKKVAIADPIATFVSPIYDLAQHDGIDLIQSWAAIVGYTAQLYFDFSGYSDMAIGLGIMFGIALPINFNSPYKSRSIIEFWRRWHITLSEFLRDYLYIPLGGSRNGRFRRYSNLLIVMLIGGLWHGAGWTFIFWGGLHGCYLIINHMWRRYSPIGDRSPLNAVFYPITFIAVCIGWVFFRSPNFETAINILHSAVSLHNIRLPDELKLYIGADHPFVIWGGGMSFIDFFAFWTYALVAYAIVFLAPNSMQVMRYNGDGIPKLDVGVGYIAMTGTLFWLAFFGIFGSIPSEFLYFQF